MDKLRVLQNVATDPTLRNYSFLYHRDAPDFSRFALSSYSCELDGYKSFNLLDHTISYSTSLFDTAMA